MIDWMARELAGDPDLAVVTVTHDRAFMEAACNRVLELDGDGGAFLHAFGGPGSYAKFREVRRAAWARGGGGGEGAGEPLRVRGTVRRVAYEAEKRAGTPRPGPRR